MKHLPKALPLLLLVCLLASCHDGNETPKPQAYLRIDLPPHKYISYDTVSLPFTFDYSDQAQIVWKKGRQGEKWLDITYPKHKGYVFLTYKPLRGPQDLRGQVDTSYKFLETHFSYSSGIDENRFVDPNNHIYGTTYRLKGQNVASTYQFWVSDSTRHFLRGSLYIDCSPNNDSLAPVLTYIQEDMNHLIESLRWR